MAFSTGPAIEEASADTIKWMSWEEMVEANQIEKKKVLVDVYTEWCGWCKVMDQKTFTDPGIIEYINKHFYAVKLDAEQKETIKWDGREFEWIAGGRNGVHTLAYSLLDGKMGYPAFVLLTQDFQRIKIAKGYQDASRFMGELKFAVDEKYKPKNSGS